MRLYNVVNGYFSSEVYFYYHLKEMAKFNVIVKRGIDSIT